MDDGTCTVRAGLRTSARTIGSMIVGSGRESTAIIVPEFNDNKVTGYNDVGNGLESVFFRVRASGAASACIVDNFKVKGVFQIFSPPFE